MAKFCSECGKELLAESSSCDACGMKLKKENFYGYYGDSAFNKLSKKWRKVILLVSALFFIFCFVIILIGSQNTNPQNQNQTLAKKSSDVDANKYKIEISNLGCEPFFSTKKSYSLNVQFKNLTDINYTGIWGDYVIKDKSGSIIEKKYFSLDRIAPNSDLMKKFTSTNASCEEIGSLEITNISRMTKIDGNYVDDNEADKILAGITMNFDISKNISTNSKESTSNNQNVNEPILSTPIYTYDSGVQLFKPSPDVCKKVSGMTQGYIETIANQYQVGISSIHFVRVISDCSFFVVDTSKGPKECIIPSVVKHTDGNFSVSNAFYSDKDHGFYNAGSCSNPMH